MSRVLSGHTGEVFALAFSADGGTLATGGDDRVIRLWNPKTGGVRQVLTGHTQQILALAFSPDNRVLASGSADATIRLWDVAEGKPAASFPSHLGTFRSLAFSPDGQILASGGDGGFVSLWDWQAKRELRAMKSGMGIIYSVTFSPDGRLVAVGSSTSLIYLWDRASGRQLNTLSGHTRAIHSLEFSSDGHLLVSGSADNTIRLWDVATGKEQRVLSGHTDKVQSVVFSPDRQRILSAGKDGTVRLWSVNKGLEEAILIEGKGSLWAMAVAQDGTMMAFGGQDRKVYLQTPPPLSLLALEDPAVARGGDSPSSADTLEPRPRLAYTYRLVDDGWGETVGNGDGRLQKGETVDLLLTLRNVGLRSTQATRVDVTAPPGQVLQFHPHTIEFGSLHPGESKPQRVTLSLGADFSASKAMVQLSVTDPDRHLALYEELQVPVDAQPAAQIVAIHSLIRVHEDHAMILSGAGSDASVLASVNKGQVLSTTGELETWYRIQISESEHGWIAKGQTNVVTSTISADFPIPRIKELDKSRSAQFMALREPQRPPAHMAEDQLQLTLKEQQEELTSLRAQLEARPPAQSRALERLIAPPAIALAAPLDNQTITTDRVQVIGTAASEAGISRIEVWVNDQKLAQRQSRGVTVLPRKDTDIKHTSRPFSELVTLREGPNEIVVKAFDSEQRSTSQRVTITRELTQGKIWAVVIGVSQYDRVDPLKYADQDAKAFHEYLIHNLGMPLDQSTLLLNEQATLFALKSALGTELKRKAGPKDTVIIYYAGHGAPESDAASLDGDGLEKYIVPYDADPNNLYATGLPMREIETIFQRLMAERVIFITDSCYSGATAGRTFSTGSRRAVISDAFLTRLSAAKGRVMFAASRAGEVSEERDELGHGVFTFYLLEGLKGKADINADGLVTVEEVYSYVSIKVPPFTGQNQHPIKKGEVEGQLILGRVR
jgi:uncharacterized caspase-like protein